MEENERERADDELSRGPLEPGETEGPGAGEHEMPGAGQHEVPGAGERVPGAGEHEMPGAGEREVHGAGEHEMPGARQREMPGAGEREEPSGGEREHEIEPDVDDEEREGSLESVTVEISGLSIYTHHGVSEAEREVGQRLVLDLRLELGEADATATDRIEDTVDYAEVCQLVTLVAQQRSHRTLERLCSTIADRLIADYELEGVWVKAAKPEPPIALPVDEVAVEIWREPGE